MTKIKIYTDVAKAKSSPKRGYIFPLVELLVAENQEICRFYQIVPSINEADFVALPLAVDYLFKNNGKKYFQEFLSLAKSNEKKLLVFTSGDYGKTVIDSNIIAIRLGGFDNKLGENTYIMSPFINDPYLFLKKDIAFLSKNTKPSIGFVGHSNGTFLKKIKEFLIYLKITSKQLVGIEHTDSQEFYPSSYHRHKMLSFFLKNDEINSDFIFRKQYRAGVKTQEERHKTSMEFFENIYKNPYTFCMRGGGNFSVRFYETLAMGRIPVLLDTNCRLPFHNEIEWSKHCLIIQENDSENIADRLLEYHNGLTEEEFISIQKNNRELWERYFNKTSFFVEFYNVLKKK
jgi:hypothetical protein